MRALHAALSQTMIGAGGFIIALSDANLAGLLRLLQSGDDETRAPLIEQLALMDSADLRRVADRASQLSGAVRGAVEDAVLRRRYRAIHADWKAALRSRDLEGALIALGQAGGARGVIDVAGRLDALARAVGDRLSGDRAFDTGLTALSEVLHGRYGLRGNVEDYGNPDNSYLQCVLESGLGVPISLCTIALLVGRRLDLPVSGIGAPGHFLGFYGEAELNLGTYFDAFNGFRRLTMSQVKALVGRYVEYVQPEMLYPVTEQEILARWLANLLAAWSERGGNEHARNLREWAADLGRE